MRWSSDRLAAFLGLHGFEAAVRATGIPRNSLACYANGTREPRATALAKLATGLGLPMEAFFTIA